MKNYCQPVLFKREERKKEIGRKEGKKKGRKEKKKKERKEMYFTSLANIQLK
jgi:predicted transposase YdaD